MRNIDIEGGEGRRVLRKDLERSLGFKLGKHHVKSGQMELGKRKERRGKFSTAEGTTLLGFPLYVYFLAPKQ